jgi:hypothetical protein
MEPENHLAVLEGRLSPEDQQRPAGAHGGDRLVPVRVEQRLRESRLGPFDIPPRRHTRP